MKKLFLCFFLINVVVVNILAQEKKSPCEADIFNLASNYCVTDEPFLLQGTMSSLFLRPDGVFYLDGDILEDNMFYPNNLSAGEYEICHDISPICDWYPTAISCQTVTIHTADFLPSELQVFSNDTLICAEDSTAFYVADLITIPSPFIFTYYLHLDRELTPHNILAVNNTGNFFFQDLPPEEAIYNRKYYVTAAIGFDDDENGKVEMYHDCTSLSNSLPITFLAPITAEYIEECIDGKICINILLKGGLPSYDVNQPYIVEGSIYGLVEGIDPDLLNPFSFHIFQGENYIFHVGDYMDCNNVDISFYENEQEKENKKLCRSICNIEAGSIVEENITFYPNQCFNVSLTGTSIDDFCYEVPDGSQLELFYFIHPTSYFNYDFMEGKLLAINKNGSFSIPDYPAIDTTKPCYLTAVYGLDDGTGLPIMEINQFSKSNTIQLNFSTFSTTCANQIGNLPTDTTIVCFQDTAIFSTTATQEENTVFTYFLHATDSLTMSNTLAVNDSGYFTFGELDTSQAAYNETYYVTAVVGFDKDGDNLPDLTDTCTVFSSPARIAFLAPLYIIYSDGCLEGDHGEAFHTPWIGVYGGLPAYDATASYYLSGTLNISITGPSGLFSTIFPAPHGVAPLDTFDIFLTDDTNCNSDTSSVINCCEFNLDVGEVIIEQGVVCQDSLIKLSTINTQIDSACIDNVEDYKILYAVSPHESLSFNGFEIPVFSETGIFTFNNGNLIGDDPEYGIPINFEKTYYVTSTIVLTSGFNFISTAPFKPIQLSEYFDANLQAIEYIGNQVALSFEIAGDNLPYTINIGSFSTSTVANEIVITLPINEVLDIPILISDGNCTIELLAPSEPCNPIVTNLSATYCVLTDSVQLITLNEGGIFTLDSFPLPDGILNPSIWPSGEHIIEYTLANDSCGEVIFSDTILIQEPDTLTVPTVTFSVLDTNKIKFEWDDVADIYEIDVQIGNNTQVITETTENTFITPIITAGTQANITVTALTADFCKIESSSSTSCILPDCLTITPTINNLPEIICYGAAPITLSATPAGGTFTGEGIVDNNILDPTLVIEGLNLTKEVLYSYTYTDSLTGCMYTTHRVVYFTFDELITSYEINCRKTDESITFSLEKLDGVFDIEPSGFSGTITMNGEVMQTFSGQLFTFTPPIGTPCTTPITAEFTGLGLSSCLDISYVKTCNLFCCPDQDFITDLAFNNLATTYCTTDEPIEIGGLGYGTYYGNGVTTESYSFDPSIAGVGSHEIAYDHFILLDPVAPDDLLCEFSLTKTVEVVAPISLEAPQILFEVVENETVEFGITTTSTQIITYEWTSTIPNGLENLSCTNCLNPVFTGGVNGLYTLMATDENGCSATTTIEVKVTTVGINEVLQQHQVVIPTLLKSNQAFTISGNDIAQTSINMYNTVGQLIYQHQPTTTSWTPNNLPTGIYLYQIEITFTDNTTIQTTGQVVVLR